MATDKATSSSSCSSSYSSILRRLNIISFLLIVFCSFYFHCCSAVQFDGITSGGLSSSTTKITGFGSSSFRKSIFSLQQQKQRQQQQQELLTKKDPLDNDDDDQGQENNGTLWVYHEDDNVLWFQDSGSKLLICVTVDEKSGDWMIRDFSQIGSKERQRYRRPPTLDILSSSRNSSSNNNNNNNNINKGWVPVEGIYGLYKLPSGIVFVLIPKTTIVYTAPPLLSSSSSSDDKKKSTNSWWQINKVNQLELVHLSRYNSNNDASTSSSSLLTQAQIKEEIRQLRLLRKALKEQEFYYIPPTKSKTKKGTTTFIMNDMTKTIQQSMLKQQKQDDDDDDTDTNWWETSDHRFVWNQAAVNPILQKYNNNNNNNNKSQQEQDELVGVLLRHVIPLTSAFVGIQSNLTLPLSSSSSSSFNANSTTTTSYEQILISRRSRYRAGTRFTRRGADATGAVANFVETEQVCIALLSTTINSSSNNNNNNNSDDETTTRISKVASHVQTRGSIPLRWSSPADVKTYRPRVRIGTDPVAQARALQLHLQETRAIYYDNNDDSSEQKEQPIIFCNLIDSKSDQGRLGRAFDAVLQAVEEVDKKSTNNNMNNNINPAKHIWFDFHAQVKNGRWDRLAILLADLEPFLESHDYFLAEPTTTTTNDDVDDPSTTLATNWNIRRTQKGIIRTNCMDCLDRTNVVQSILGRKVLFQQLVPEIASAAEDNNNKQEESLWIQKARKKFQKRQQLTLPWKDGEAAHRALWADNADAISKIYAGTPALKRDFTRTGKRTKIGALDDGMNSLQRYYLNNFLDADRQEGMDLLVGFANFSDSNSKDQSSSSGLKQATRHGLLGSLLDRKELLPSLKEVGLDGSPEDDESILDLRWVPGDLQAHLRSQSEDSSATNKKAEETTASKTKFEFSFSKALKAIDQRSTSDLPWWWQKEDDNNQSPTNNLLEPHQRHPILTRGQVFGVLVLGVKAPKTLATSVVSLLVLLYLADIVQKDISSIQKKKKK